MQLGDIHIRDPYILLAQGRYYLYGSYPDSVRQRDLGVNAYVSDDLTEWQPLPPVFVRPDGFWSDGPLWAPEVHAYGDAYYLFATFAPCGARLRSTQILRADSPEGPFVPIGEAPITPADWMSLDGTLYMENATPYMVFCHEWAQIVDGTMCAVKLTEDLSKPVGDPITLFAASDHPCVADLPLYDGVGQITDGPCLHRLPSGALLMLWASGVKNGNYGEILSISRNGSLFGPWEHLPTPLFDTDGGHGMLFFDKEGALRFVLHQPNGRESEHPVIFYVKEEKEGLTLCNPIGGIL